tara:strand:- start:400 stop:792 length:393 start_codon:yes stop_codon:yes gene_type:complete
MIEKTQKLSALLSEYFQTEETTPSSTSLYEIALPVSLPIRPDVCEWEIHSSPERFSRKFKFPHKHAVKNFVVECLNYEMENNHTGTYRIDGLEVTVEVYTHDVDRITELDQEFTRDVGNIYKDVLNFGRY